MIVTVTMNPAIDKTIDVDKFEVGGLNRIKSTVLDVGGKGINVSKTIKAIDGESLAIGFVGGSTGDLIESTLLGLGIKTDFVRVDGDTRTNTKVFSSNYGVTELNEQGSVITKEQLEELIAKIESYAKDDTLFVLAGSVPKGVPTDIYKTITELVRKKGSKVLLDADGELLFNSLEATPNFIKPNQIELAQYAKITHDISEQEILNISRGFLKDGIELVAISMGKEGAIFVTEDKVTRCPPIDVEVKSTVGAGDAMVAAMAYSIDKKSSLEDTMILCMATSAGAVTTVGTKPPSQGLVNELKSQVIIEEIGE